MQAQTMATASNGNAETSTTDNNNRSVPNSYNYHASQINGTGGKKNRLESQFPRLLSTTDW